MKIYVACTRTSAQWLRCHSTQESFACVNRHPLTGCYEHSIRRARQYLHARGGPVGGRTQVAVLDRGGRVVGLNP